MNDILIKLERVLELRKSAKTDVSYVSSLYQGGTEIILKKVAEETTELIMAVKDNDESKIIYEVADLWFHTLVLLRHKNITVDKINKELLQRFALSGIQEKANRNKEKR